MKLPPFVFLATLGLAIAVHSQDAKSTIKIEPAPFPASTAHILGTIRDGTPPPPEAPKPEFIVPTKDILDTTVIEQGGRTITLREIKPIALPPPPPAFVPVPPDPTFQAHFADEQVARAGSPLLFLSATVYRSKDSPPRTLVRWRSQVGGESINFWSSADFALIAGGIQSFADSVGATHFLSIGWGNVEVEQTTDLKTEDASPSAAPAIPDFPAGAATFAFIGKAPTDEDLLVIQSLHDLYNKNHDELLTAYQGREQARLTREADLKAHPPPPKDITLNFWRTEKPAPANGGAK